MSKKILIYRREGQAVAEMIVFLPVLVILGSIAVGVAYMCWQGIKVQEAANYAARLEGQERVAGGSNTTSINNMNGVGVGLNGDVDITKNPTVNSNMSAADVAGNQHKPLTNSVYRQYYDIVRSMFGSGENNGLLLPAPVQGSEIDQVKVIRVMNPPSVFGVKIPQVVVTGTAYGGEDSNMYALPRWGCTGTNQSGDCNPYWAQSLNKEDPAPKNPLQ